MNYLAHLHIADHCQSSLLGNLLGDFVKGDPDSQYVAPIASGIRLHRLVDAYTDSHPVISHAKQCFSADTRRFAPIALDMFWDHCLASQWAHYHDLSLSRFVRQAHQRVTREQAITFAAAANFSETRASSEPIASPQPIALPDRFNRVSGAMWQGGWLESYAELSNIEFALQRMSQRSVRMGKLAHCFDGLSRHYSRLAELFTVLYPDVLEKAKRSEL
ncbi:acyl carrier protein phosphodiesterase [Vibrio ostreae]|uniref:DUF479 domain-containing protein n=1 Tax=Vibrio ostreae TaxID=2841925 RepID=A0A975U741_9VIBR|nr:ACP phosphodiesterase [Vibrio ostreae]QXO16449.1 DUF479 domain-containing protein [Vibrio ostreae]